MKKLSIILLGMAAYFWASECPAATITVNWDGSGDYTTIQAGIDAATAGDEVVVSEGTYSENINFSGKDIVLTSLAPDDWAVVAGTIIDGQGLDSVVKFNGTESSDCKLAGFTITGGNVPRSGGGIRGLWTNATVANCIVKNNTAGKHGGGIHSINGRIDSCIIYANTASMNGGGIAFSDGKIVNCLVYGNRGQYGGGMVECNGDIVNCTVVKNTATEVGGGTVWCRGTITNCIVWENSQPQVATSALSIVTYCCIQDWEHGGLGNITTDPLFVDAAWDVYYLQLESGCIDAGTNEPPGGLAETDIDGNIRPIDGNDDGAAVADIGAYEVLVSEVPVISVSSRDVEFWVFEGDARPADKILGIRNSGPGTISWEITEDCDWLEVNPTVGSSAGQINEVTLSVDTTGLVVGEYVCYLIVAADGVLNSPQTIGVNLHVTDPLLVPAEYGTIQGAINAAVDGDTVLVADGLYTGQGNYNIDFNDFNGKAITVRSENGPENCIIDCQWLDNDPGSGFYFQNQEGNDSVVDGFTITNATNSAIVCIGQISEDRFEWLGASPTISNCIITGNTTYYGGGGIFCGQGSAAVITNCIIKNNSASGQGWFIDDGRGSGGGIYCGPGSSPVITNCIIENNSAFVESSLLSGGGGIFCEDSDVTIANSTIVGNSTGGNGGGVLCFSSDVEITNSIVWNNRARNGSELAIKNEDWFPYDDSSVLTVSYSDVRGGEDAVYFERGEPNPLPPGPGPGPGTLEWGEGNMDIDPLFVDTGNGNYHLQLGSACVDAGTNSPEGGLGIVDLDGNTRVLDGDSDGAAVVDMGVYESFAPDVPYMATIPNEFIFHVFEGGPNPDNQILQIRNIGPDGFDWEIQEDCQWLEIWPTSGRIEMETDEVVLQVDKTGLRVGAYKCQLSVLSEQAANSPHTVEVKLYVYLDGAKVVPLRFPTIQETIDRVAQGKTIMVAPGTYYENIYFNGKNVILTSIDPDDPAVVAATVIDGRGLDSVVTFAGSENENCKLLGFTITGGNANNEWPYRGGGVAGQGTEATISKCVIKDNAAQRHGGGVSGVDGMIDRCRIFNNSALLNGGGLVGCHGEITNCLIYDNCATGFGGGMMQCDGDIIHCTIADNTAAEGGGLSHCNGNITNCIIWGNHFKQLAYSSNPTYSCIQDFYGGVGNIYTEPGFVNTPAGDYHLRFDSSCVDAGSKGPEEKSFPPAVDIEGNPRPLDGNYDGTAVADMGAYEVSPPEAPFMALNQSVFVFHCLEGGPNPAEQILEIRNPGTGSFGWEIVADCDWLGVFPTTGETTEDVDEVTLHVDTTGLEAGGHICELRILSRQAVNPGAPGLTIWIMLNIYNEGDIIVPVDYATIQGAIDAALARQTIIVEPGTYNENIDFGGKNITLRSIEPQDWAVVKRTIIQGDGTRSVVKFSGTEDPNCMLAGFTITGGNVPRGGGGIRGKWTRATVANCIIKNNTAGTHGGGIHSINGSIDSCTIYANTSGMDGGGIAYSDGKIVNCLVYGNQGAYGGGMSECNGNIINCTVIKNTATEVGGGMVWCWGTITNCLVWGNWSNEGNQQVATHRKSFVTYCCIQDWVHGGLGNIATTDPLFVNAQSGDYRLSPGSSCVDAGTNEPPAGPPTPEGSSSTYIELPATDIDGNIRLIDGDYDGQAIVDIGAYEQTELVGIEISGPEKIEANWSTKYNLIARHKDGSSGETAGGAVNWWVEPTTHAGFGDGGVLWTQDVDSRQEIMIYAEYVNGYVSTEARKAVSILPICPAGAALQLDGRGDYVEIAGFKGVTGVRSRTVSAWIKTTTTTVGEIISWGYDRTMEVWEYDHTGGFNWVFMVLAEGNLRLGVGGRGINGTTFVADGRWHHVAAVLQSDGTPDLSDVKLYVDGIREPTTGPSRIQQINTAGGANVQIGVLSGGDALGDKRYFEGTIDEVRIWNVWRTQQEIRANMHRRLKGDEPGLVGYWNFDEGQGRVVYDSSPKGNNGYLRYGPAWADSDAPIGFCNTPPVADAGDDQSVYAWIDGIAEVKLDGSGSFDADADSLEYYWFIDGERIATGVDPNVLLGIGEHMIELIVDDGVEDSEPNEVVITVIAPIEADIHIVPRTINRNNRMKRVMAIMRLPEGITKQDITDQPFVLYVDSSDADGIEAIWDRVIGRGNQATVFALFDKDEVMNAVEGVVGRVELTVVGRLESGQYIQGSDTVRVVQPRREAKRISPSCTVSLS